MKKNYNSRTAAPQSDEEALSSKGFDPSAFSVLTRTEAPLLEDNPDYQELYQEAAAKERPKAFTNNPATAEKFPELFIYNRDIADRVNKSKLNELKSERGIAEETRRRNHIDKVNEIKGRFHAVDQMLANSSYGCNTCDSGRIGESKPALPGEARDVCPECNDWGYTLNPTKDDYYANLKKHVNDHNSELVKHETLCTVYNCKCKFKPFFDRIRNFNPDGTPRDKSTLLTKDIFLRHNSPEGVKEMLRPYALHDEMKNTGMTDFLGGRGVEPIQKGDHVGVINFDTDPLSKDYSPWQMDPEIVDQTKVGRNPWEIPQIRSRLDNRITAHVVNVNKEGTHADVIYQYRPDSVIREDMTERNRHYGRPMEFPSFEEAMDTSYPSNWKTDPDTEEKAALRYTIPKILDPIKNSLGRPSPVSHESHANFGYAKNVPVESLVRLSPATLPLWLHQGSSTARVPEDSLKQFGYSKPEKNNNFSKKRPKKYISEELPGTNREPAERKIEARVIRRGDHVFGFDTLPLIQKIATNPEMAAAARRYAQHVDRHVGIPEGSEFSQVVSMPGRVLKPQKKRKPITFTESQEPRSTAEVPEVRRDVAKNIRDKANSSAADEIEAPPTIDINEAIESLKDGVRQAKNNPNEDFDLDWHKKAEESILRTGSVHGAMKELGFSHPEDEEDDKYNF